MRAPWATACRPRPIVDWGTATAHCRPPGPSARGCRPSWQRRQGCRIGPRSSDNREKQPPAVRASEASVFLQEGRIIMSLRAGQGDGRSEHTGSHTSRDHLCRAGQREWAPREPTAPSPLRATRCGTRERGPGGTRSKELFEELLKCTTRNPPIPQRGQRIRIHFKTPRGPKKTHLWIVPQCLWRLPNPLQGRRL